MTPSPESRTIPVDLPVANLHEKTSTMIELPEQPRILQGLGIFQKRFQPFFSCVWWDSYWLQWGELDTRWGISLARRKHVSIGATYRPSFRWLRAKGGTSAYRDLFCYCLTLTRCRFFLDWKDWESRPHIWGDRRYISAKVHWGEYEGKFLFSTKADLHEPASLDETKTTLSMTTGDFRNESIYY